MGQGGAGACDCNSRLIKESEAGRREAKAKGWRGWEPQVQSELGTKVTRPFVLRFLFFGFYLFFFEDDMTQNVLVHFLFKSK